MLDRSDFGTLFQALHRWERRALFLPPAENVKEPHPHSSDRLVEWFLACLMFAWGAWMLWPTYNTMSQPQYVLMVWIEKQVESSLGISLNPDTAWGSLALMLSLIRMYALWRNGRINPWSTRTRLVGTVIGGMWWTLVGMLIALSGVVELPGNIGHYPVFFLFEGIAARRVVRDAYICTRSVNALKARAAIAEAQHPLLSLEVVERLKATLESGKTIAPPRVEGPSPPRSNGSGSRYG